jgi:hypothetical protein
MLERHSRQFSRIGGIQFEHKAFSVSLFLLLNRVLKSKSSKKI